MRRRDVQIRRPSVLRSLEQDWSRGSVTHVYVNIVGDTITTGTVRVLVRPGNPGDSRSVN